MLEKKQVSKSKQAANNDKTRYSSEEQAIIDTIEVIKKKLEVADKSVQKAEDELGRLRSLPPLPEPSHFEEKRMAQQVVEKKDYVPPSKYNVGQDTSAKY